MGVVFRQAWSGSQWTVLMGYLTISTNVRRYQTHHKLHFVSFQEDSALVHCACNTVQLLQRCRLTEHLSKEEGQHPLTGQRAANFRRDLAAT